MAPEARGNPEVQPPLDASPRPSHLSRSCDGFRHQLRSPRLRYTTGHQQRPRYYLRRQVAEAAALVPRAVVVAVAAAACAAADAVEAAADAAGTAGAAAAAGAAAVVKAQPKTCVIFFFSTGKLAKTCELASKRTSKVTSKETRRQGPLDRPSCRKFP